jgi:ribosomal protein L44E
MPKARQASETDSAQAPKEPSIFCPYCKRASVVNIGADSPNMKASMQQLMAEGDPKTVQARIEMSRLPVHCDHCKKAFFTLLGTVRAKRSRWAPSVQKRYYSVRIKRTDDAEELIEYDQDGYYDFELRSGDLAAFSYMRKWGDEILKITQNLTVGRHQVNSKLSFWERLKLFGQLFGFGR